MEVDFAFRSELLEGNHEYAYSCGINGTAWTDQHGVMCALIGSVFDFDIPYVVTQRSDVF